MDKTSSLAATLLLSTALCLTVAAVVAADPWSPVVPVSDQDQFDDEFPVLFRGPDGAPWVVWMGIDPSELDEEVYYSRWNGFQWESPATVNPPNQIDDRIPRVSRGHDGSVWVLWKVPDLAAPGSYDGVVSRWGNGTWTRPDTVWTGGGRQDVCDVAAVSENDVWVVRNGATGTNADSDIWVYHLNNGTLDPEVQFSDPDSLDTIPQIAANANGEVWVAWDKTAVVTPQYSRLTTAHRTIGGWESPKSLSAPLGINRLGLSLDQDGVTWLVCMASDPETGPFSDAVWALRWRNNGWDPAERISDPVAASDTTQYQLSVSGEGSRSLRVIWVRGSVFSITRRDPITCGWTGAAWTPPEIAGNLADSTDASWPATFEEDTGRLWVAYMRLNPATFVSNIATIYRPFVTTSASGVTFEVTSSGEDVLLSWTADADTRLIEVYGAAGTHTSPTPPGGPEARLVLTAIGAQARSGFRHDQGTKCGEVTSYWARAVRSDGSDHWIGPRVGRAADCGRPRIQGAAPIPSRDAIEIRGTLGGHGNGVLEVIDVRGRVQRTITIGETEADPGTPGGFAVRWNGADRAGRMVPSGVYFVRVRSLNGSPSETRRVVWVQ